MATAHNEVKVAMITGYLGAGKTTLLNHVLANDQGIRAAVIVNDIGEVNIDADLVAASGAIVELDDVIPMTNGCICCTLADDLAEQLRKIANTGDFDYIIIEASGICEPLPIAYTISDLAEAAGEADAPLVLDNIVSVVDCARMYEEFNGGRDLTRDDLEEDDVESLIIQQIEFCTTLVMNKADLVTDEQMSELRAIVRSLQKNAVIVEATNSAVPLAEVISTGRFDFVNTYNSATWADALAHPDEHAGDALGGDDHRHADEGGSGHHHDHGHDHDHDHGHDHGHGHGHHHHHAHHGHHEELEYGFSTFVYRRRKPFDLASFGSFVENWPDEIVRCKGILWRADAIDVRFLFEQAGRHFYLSDNGFFVAAEPAEDREALLAEYPGLLDDWDDELGDRMTKLVFIGRHMDQQAIESQLDACLVEISGD